MFKKRFMQMTILGIKQFRDPYYQGFAAQLSFYFLLALVPIFMLIAQLLTVTEIIPMNKIVEIINQYIGKELPIEISSLLNSKIQTTTNIVFIIIALWAASRAQFSMGRITTYTLTEGRTTGRGYFRERFRAVFTMLITLFTICFSLVILVYGDEILALILAVINNTFNTKSDIDDVWLSVRWVVAAVLFFLTISYNYYMLPAERIRYKAVIPGSIFAAVGLLIVTLVYAKYASSIANYDIIYGSLASIAAIMIWFYFIAWVLCLGVLFNKVWDDTKDMKLKAKE